MEEIKTNSLGQWRLVKSAKPKFDPRSEWTSSGGQARSSWVSDATDPEEARQAKASIPKMEGPARIRAISKLTAATQHRRNPNTGKLEFLLHRGMSTGEAGANVKQSNTQYPEGTQTSWTPKLEIAHRQAYYEEPRGKVVSAWVPEDALHSSMRQYSGPTSRMRALTSKEDEWIVNHLSTPHELHQITDAQNPRKISKP